MGKSCFQAKKCFGDSRSDSVSEKIAGLGRETQKKFLQFCIEMFRQALMMNYETKDWFILNPKVDKFKKICLCKW
jgi:hypothetical protein